MLFYLLTILLKGAPKLSLEICNKKFITLPSNLEYFYHETEYFGRLKNDLRSTAIVCPFIISFTPKRFCQKANYFFTNTLSTRLFHLFRSELFVHQKLNYSPAHHAVIEHWLTQTIRTGDVRRWMAFFCPTVAPWRTSSIFPLPPSTPYPARSQSDAMYMGPHAL
jgi:hypothetical protein